MRKRVYQDYIHDILATAQDIMEFVEGMGFEDFKNDKKTIYAVIRGIEVIAEAAKKIPKSIKDKHSAIPWKDMAGMRDKLIHEYFGVDIAVLWKTVEQDLPLLRSLISGAIADLVDE